MKTETEDSYLTILKVLKKNHILELKKKHLLLEGGGVCRIWVKVYKRGGNAHSAPLPRLHFDEKFVCGTCV